MVSRLSIKTFQLAAALIIWASILTGCQDTIPNRDLIYDASQVGGTTGSTDGGEKTGRSDGAVKFKTNFCGCKDNVAITYGNCTTFCSDKNTQGAGILFVEFNVTEDISLNSKFQNIDGWCNTPLADDESNPRCLMKATDENTNEVPLDVAKGTKVNALKVNIDNLQEDKAYVLTLFEVSSGAKSDSIQIIKYSSTIPITNLGPLKNAPINQYSCIYRPLPEGDSDGIYYDFAFKTHYYYLPRIPPNPIPAGSDIICHDWMNPLYGAIDDILYPRLELVPGVFNLWDNTDPRFYDNNGNDNEDVNDIIIQKAKNFGATNLKESIKFFEKFPTLTTEEANEEAGGAGSVAQSMGYYMFPWIDSVTFRSYCLNSTHYDGSNPLFRAMRDVVGVDMEGIYVGAKAPETVKDPRTGELRTAPPDFLFIRETDLKKVWFYFKNNVPTAPTDAVVSGVPVYFYYPLNPASPFVRSSTQKLYQVKGATELSTESGGNNPTGTSTSIPPHDRKLGCIPKF